MVICCLWDDSFRHFEKLRACLHVFLCELGLIERRFSHKNKTKMRSRLYNLDISFYFQITRYMSLCALMTQYVLD